MTKITLKDNSMQKLDKVFQKVIH